MILMGRINSARGDVLGDRSIVIVKLSVDSACFFGRKRPVCWLTHETPAAIITEDCLT